MTTKQPGPEGIGNALREISEQLNPVFTVWQERGELRTGRGCYLAGHWAACWTSFGVPAC